MNCSRVSALLRMIEFAKTLLRAGDGLMGREAIKKGKVTRAGKERTSIASATPKWLIGGKDLLGRMVGSRGR
jgi:hypothetical protein